MSDEFEGVLIQLEALRFTPDRSEIAARSGLQDFLHEAASLRPIVSARPPRRLTGWMSKLTQERSPMFALALKLMLVLAVMLGGVGVTAAAAQSSLPNEALYPVKLLIEEVQLSLASTPAAQLDAQLEQAQQRVREMAQLTDRGVGIPEEVPARLQVELQAALHIAAQLDDQQLPPALERIQLRTQDQLRAMEQRHLDEPAQVLTQARELAQLGVTDPQSFRERLGFGRPADAPAQPQRTPQAEPSHTPIPQISVTPQPSRTPLSTPTPESTCTPPYAPTRTPQGQSYGTPSSTATPVGQGEGHAYGPGPQATREPGGEPQPQNTPQGSDEPRPQNTPQGSGDPAPQNTPQAGSGGNGPQAQNTPAPVSTPQVSGGPGRPH